MKPIWYFVGLAILIIGGLVTLAGILDYLNPPEKLTILSHLYPGIWWGLFMMIVGLFFFVKYKNVKID